MSISRTIAITLMALSVLFFIVTNAISIARHVPFQKFVTCFCASTIPMTLFAMYLGGVFD